jgi:CBS domain-containing protein
MVWPVATVHADATLREVAESLAADAIGALGVLEHGVLAGVVSERDVVNHLAQGANPDHLSAGEVMSTELVTVRPEETVLEAAHRMLDAEVRHLPVIQDGEIAGFVSIRDLFEVLVRTASLEDDVVVVPSGTRVVVRQD